jgi:hypothetical protein
MSIRLRLTLYWAAVLAGILIAAAAAVLTLFDRYQWGALDAALLEEADTAAEAIARGGIESAASTVRALSLERDLGPRRHVVLIAGGEVIADYGNAKVEPPKLDAPLKTHLTVHDRSRGFRFAVVPFSLGGREAYLFDGVGVRSLEGTVARLRTSSRRI